MATRRSPPTRPSDSAHGGDPLRVYREKRNADRTPEPLGGDAADDHHTQVFVIQEHHARAHHFDFRLAHGGVLVSWALPKGLPEDPARNHLAIHTEDHPLEYATFEGTIPKGEYGGGTVAIFDEGSYELEKWSEREVKVVLHGRRSAGRYVLFATDGKNWMIHKMNDEVTAVARKVSPMLASGGELPPTDDGWAYEFKWDGVRALVSCDRIAVTITSRNDKDLTGDFPEVTAAVASCLHGRSALLDGELVAFNDAGRPDFGRLQRRLHLGSPARAAQAAGEFPVHLLAFDLLCLDGESLLEASYDERRRSLESLGLVGGALATPPSFPDRRGVDVLAAARDAGLEGVVAKRRASRYRPGARGGDWIKVKNFRTQEVVLGGWTAGKGERRGELGALLLGIPAADGRLTYVGKVGTGFDASSRRALLERLAAIEVTTSPFDGPLPSSLGELRFVRPELVGEVRYGEWTRAQILRHPTWRGLRVDKEPKDVYAE